MKFKPGQSGNPNGRPKGTGQRQKLLNALVMPHKEALIEKAIGLALDGNEAMLRLLLEHLLPNKNQDETVSISLPENITSPEAMPIISEAILRDLEQQNITPNQAKHVFEVLRLYRDNVMIEEIHQKIIRLQSLINELPHKNGKFN